jgi:RNA-directed DNA polymerase
MTAPDHFARAELNPFAGGGRPHMTFAVRPDGAYHQWRKDPSRELSIALVADERFGRVTGWMFGPHCYQRNGNRYLGASPSAKSVKRVKLKVNEVLVPGNLKPWPVRDRVNSLLRGWSAYFGYGTRGRAYKAVDHHVCGRVRHFLCRRHKVPDRGTRRFPHDRIYGSLGVLALDYRRVPHNEPSRKAGCGKSACPV